MKSREASRHARDRVIDDLIREHGVNATVVIVAVSLGMAVRGAVPVVLRRARAIGEAT